jgi:hypothetical protein
MDNITDARVKFLFRIVNDGNEPMLNDQQRTAIKILGDMARSGNESAMKALTELLRAPFIHPLLRETIDAERRLPLPRPAKI